MSLRWSIQKFARSGQTHFATYNANINTPQEGRIEMHRPILRDWKAACTNTTVYYILACARCRIFERYTSQNTFQKCCTHFQHTTDCRPMAQEKHKNKKTGLGVEFLAAMTYRKETYRSVDDGRAYVDSQVTPPHPSLCRSQRSSAIFSDSIVYSTAQALKTLRSWGQGWHISPPTCQYRPTSAKEKSSSHRITDDYQNVFFLFSTNWLRNQRELYRVRPWQKLRQSKSSAKDKIAAIHHHIWNTVTIQGYLNDYVWIEHLVRWRHVKVRRGIEKTQWTKEEPGRYRTSTHHTLITYVEIMLIFFNCSRRLWNLKHFKEWNNTRYKLYSISIFHQPINSIFLATEISEIISWSEKASPHRNK